MKEPFSFFCTAIFTGGKATSATPFRYIDFFLYSCLDDLSYYQLYYYLNEDKHLFKYQCDVSGLLSLAKSLLSIQYLSSYDNYLNFDIGTIFIYRRTTFKAPEHEFSLE